MPVSHGNSDVGTGAHALYMSCDLSVLCVCECALGQAQSLHKARLIEEKTLSVAANDDERGVAQACPLRLSNGVWETALLSYWPTKGEFT